MLQVGFQKREHPFPAVATGGIGPFRGSACAGETQTVGRKWQTERGMAGRLVREDEGRGAAILQQPLFDLAHHRATRRGSIVLRANKHYPPHDSLDRDDRLGMLCERAERRPVIIGHCAALARIERNVRQAFSRHDAKAWVKFCTPDAQLVTVRGESMKGIAAIEKGLARIFETRGRNVRLKTLDVAVRFIRPDRRARARHQ